MTDQFFSFPRFKSYLRCYTATNAKPLLLCAAGILICWLLLALLPAMVGINNVIYYQSDIWDPAWKVEATGGLIIAFIFAALSGSRFFDSMHGRLRAQHTLLLPASQFEKFLSYFLIYIVGFVAVFVASGFLADWIRVGYVHLFCPWAVATTHPISFDRLFSATGWNDEPIIRYVTCLIYLGFFWQLAVFTLGSILWQKHCFWKTVGALFLLQIAFNVCFAIGDNIFGGDYDGMFKVTEEQIKGVIVGFNVLLGVLEVFVIWLSYKRFTETDMIERW